MIITGRSGSGKTYLACAFGNKACHKGYSVKYYRIPELLIEIQDAITGHGYPKFIKQLERVNLLILDDIGLKAYTLEESRALVEAAESRCNKASTIIVGQTPHGEWYDLFPDPITADAFMDRMIHSAIIMPLDSQKSMRQVMAAKKMGSLTGLEGGHSGG